MTLFCPNCKANTTELIDCENCGGIGCPKCIRKKNKKWVCHTCSVEKPKENGTMADVFTSMFG
ncbi:MAG: hypothetical protein QXY45_02430 [Candidatus Aenigmatarchaeota archaeon]